MAGVSPMTGTAPEPLVVENRLPAVVHVDLDGLTDIYTAHAWDYPHNDDPIYETGLNNILAWFERSDIRATLFVIASSLDSPGKLELVQEAVRRGHEVASHSLTHAHLLGLNREQKRREIGGSREKLEACLGVRVRGFRAPGYQIDRECIELLAQSGYSYDTSAFPTKVFARRLRVDVAALTAPQRPFAGSPLVELPLPDHRPWPFPFNPSYSLVLGLRYFRLGLSRCLGHGQPLVLLFHLIDMADPLPRHRVRGPKARVFTLSTLSREQKLERCQEMLALVRERCRVTTTAGLLEELAGLPRGESTMERSDAVQLVLVCLRDGLAGDDEMPPTPPDETTPLIGSGAILDSLGLVTLILDVEQRLQAGHGLLVTLADERAMSQKHSPFRTVSTLADYICELAEQQRGDG